MLHHVVKFQTQHPKSYLSNKSGTNIVDIRRIVVIRVHIVVSVTEIRIVGNRTQQTFIISPTLFLS